MEKEYDKEPEEIKDEIEQELTKEELELREIEKEQSVKTKNGQVEFKSVNHSERATALKRGSDKDTTEYVNIALEYFGYRCALSGERFTKFDGKVQKTSAKSNLSAEHVVALCLGGDDIVPNIVPTVLQYNIRKNGYYLLDYWDKQKDTEGKSLYSPYRLLKLVNYMMKSIEARKSIEWKDVKHYRKAIMTPNEIDEFLAEIERQDEIEPDNSKKKIHSDTITATTLDEDNKKVLTQVPTVEGNIPSQREQLERFRQNEIDMMDIFLSDAVSLLSRTKELQQVRLKDKDGNEISLQDKLDEMLKSTIGVIPFEVEVRNAILEKLEAIEIQDNKYSVANDLLNNTLILEMANANRENLKLIVEDYVENQLSRIRETQILNEEQLKTVISNMPTILYNEKEMNKIRLWRTYRKDSFEELISRDYTATDIMVDVLIVLKINGIDLSKIVQRGKIDDLIKEKDEDEEEQNKIINELQEISKEITRDWPIGRKLNTQKTDNMEKLKKEIEKAEIILTLEEQKVLEKEGNKELSERKTREFVQVLVVLKNNGIDLSKIIVGESTIEDLIKEKDEELQNKIVNELQDISKGIQKNWPIGRILSAQKGKNKIIQLKEELEKERIELTPEEQQKILGNMSGITTKEFVQVLVVLKNNGIDLSKIVLNSENASTIEDLIKEKDEEEQNKIISELQKISEYITTDWPIGKKLKDKKARNIEQLKEEIEKVELKLTLEEQKKILGKVSGITTKEFVQVLVVLKNNGIDLSKIVQNSKNASTIEDLIKEKNEENQNKIINELQEVSEEITKDWPIGQRLNTQKVRNMVQLKEEIEKEGIKLTSKEQQRILENMSGITTEEFVQVLVVLNTNEIDLSKIVQNSKNASTIEDLIKEKDEEEQNKIINELQEISKEITRDWPIGRKLNDKKKNMVQLQKEIEKARIELTDKERKKILGKTVQKKVKETVVEQKNKGELGQNQQIEEDVFEETIIQAEKTQENNNSER